jgi:hypothetical protein
MFSSWLMKSLRFCGVIRDIPRFASRKSESFGQRELGCIIARWAKERPEGLLWIWIGRHDRYDEILKS